MEKTKKCFYCSKSFLALKWNSKFCCRPCQAKSAYQKKIGLKGRSSDKRKCGFCGGMHGNLSAKYCSDPCRTRAMSILRNGKRRARIKGVPSHKIYAAEIIERDGRDCAHCGIETQTINRAYPAFMNIDHIIPLCKGGHNTIYNVQILCAECNNIKGSGINDFDFAKAKKLWPTDPIKYMEKRRSIKSNNKSGVQGVFFDKGIQKWTARIEIDKHRITIIRTKDKDLAIQCRKYAEKLNKEGAGLIEVKAALKEYIDATG